MCYNCGCHNPSDDMGDPNNITLETFTKAAKAMGQDLQEAKQKTYELLKLELEGKHDN